MTGETTTDGSARTGPTTPSRARDRMRYDTATVHAVLDEAYVCHVGTVVDGRPSVLPMLHARIGETLYLHGSTGGRLGIAARAAAADGVPVCVTVTLLDGLVLARSQFHHSVNYRSVVTHGAARLVTDDAERQAALTAIVDRVAPGRSDASRPPTAPELAATAVLALSLATSGVKVRAHGVVDEPADLDLPYWAGVVGLRTVAGRPEPDAGVTVPVPVGLRPARSPWLTAAALPGRAVTLEPLDLAHVDGLFAALGDAEVWRHLGHCQPTDRAGMAAIVTEALEAAEAGRRVPWVQLETGTGRVVGTTSFWNPDPLERTVHLGSSLLGRPFWRTAINTESKLLLLGRAFDDLGAVRVELWTDVTNERSQRAIERLGAVREGVLRRHRRRADGTWRDTVSYALLDSQWPEARARLADRLAAGGLRAGARVGP